MLHGFSAKRITRRLVGCGVALVILGLGGEGSAQENVRVLLQRMDRLERDMGAVQRQIHRGGVSDSVSFGGGDPEGDTAARLQQRLIDMEGVISNLTGQTEEVRFELGQLRGRLEKLITDVDFRLTELERSGKNTSSPGSSGAGETTAPVAPGLPPGHRTDREAIAVFGKPTGQKEPIGEPAQASSPKRGGESSSRGTPKEQYDQSVALLNQNDFAAAEQALLAFLEAHPEDPLAGNAQYWLGEAHYARGDFRQAAVAFAKGYQKYAKSSKAPANLLKLGLSLARLKRVQDACTAFNRLAVEFPNGSGDVKQRANHEKKNLGCK
ncbi:MAG: hypothetical protein FD149_199 [Rhodospirillaceae bacterium]|nr:MAG: hypothetical protein FD149_199 [Rhodospirillaceae bacterium]